ncbi:hypothetical protein TVAG_391680 [Trichomonas vaginalis G3]|uniref:Uncharacterized protein n=1 Tax=Trichomonas vaginalis (strain ATCC PRA-98 / G3) TaxID=412133 RepID=A2DFT1_TRIV3|nr:regulator of cytokinesis 1 PRC1-related family [Trichomonas vaginalis G3]EAY20784.1 hypothetical protein TVAG_391680 [Trichomonas vaginalis G3]KAI5529430.1 regulator of cytokinesis 1 PRC1-related family [Trichomonas vaginalis G3]|eukprot:XP_001581770.1 hypothetical protein [Trichomonas vaginalis G3]
MSKKLISFMIDPNLDRLWTAIGFTKVEKAAEAKKLELALIEAYQKFIAETNINCEDLRGELRNAIFEYQHVQQIFGDEGAIPSLSPKYSLRDQINYMNDVTEELKMKYDSRVKEFDEIASKLSEQYKILKINEEDRGEFAEVGTSDLTLSRLERFKQTNKKLDAEIQQRTKLFESLVQQITETSEYIQETIPDKFQTIIENKNIDNDSISKLTECLNSLQELQETNKEQLDNLWKRISYLYEVLDFDTKSRRSKPQNPSVQEIDSLLNEIESLQKQIEDSLPTLVKSLQRDIKKVCDDLRISPANYIRFTGDNEDLESRAIFLRRQLNDLKQRQIKAQPIISLISEIESANASLKNDPTKSYMSRERGAARKRVEEEKQRKIAVETIPKLEQKLLKLLAQFKEENKYDFQFEGVDLTNLGHENDSQVAPVNLSSFPENGTSQISRRTGKQTLGKTLLLQKLNSEKNETKNMKQTTRRRPLY